MRPSQCVTEASPLPGNRAFPVKAMPRAQHARGMARMRHGRRQAPKDDSLVSGLLAGGSFT